MQRRIEEAEHRIQEIYLMAFRPHGERVMPWSSTTGPRRALITSTRPRRNVEVLEPIKDGAAVDRAQ